MPDHEARWGLTAALIPAEDDEHEAGPAEAVFYEAPRTARPLLARPATTHPAPYPTPDGATMAEQSRPAEAAPSSFPQSLAAPSHSRQWSWREWDWRGLGWKTWQVAAGCAVALIVGMMVGNTTRSSAHRASESVSAPSRASQSQPTAGAPQTTTTAATPTTASPTTVAASAAGGSGASHVVLDLRRATGPKRTDHFTVSGARWTLGWAYDCSGQGGAGSFKVTILNADGSLSQDGVIDQQGAKGSSVAAYTSTGERSLAVDTPCVWAVKVTA